MLFLLTSAQTKLSYFELCPLPLLAASCPSKGDIVIVTVSVGACKASKKNESNCSPNQPTGFGRLWSLMVACMKAMFCLPEAYVMNSRGWFSLSAVSALASPSSVLAVPSRSKPTWANSCDSTGLIDLKNPRAIARLRRVPQTCEPIMKRRRRRTQPSTLKSLRDARSQTAYQGPLRFCGRPV